MAIAADETILRTINPSRLYSAAELTAIQKNLDTKQWNMNSVYNMMGQQPYPAITTFPRLLASGSGVASVTQRLQLTRFTADKTFGVTSVSVIVHATAAGATPTLVRHGIYTINDSTGDITLVGSTTNDTTLLAATSTKYTKALTTPITLDGGRDYYHGILIVSAAAFPVMAGITFIAADIATLPIPCYQVTGLADLPATVAFASLAASVTANYVELI